MKVRNKMLTLALATSALLASGSTYATELRFMCSAEGNSCASIETLIEKFEKENDGIAIKMDVVPQKAIAEGLPLQLSGGAGPDLATVVNLGGLAEHYLNLSPYVDTKYWEENFGGTLDWYRNGPKDKGINGLHSEFTITGAYINRTLFEQAEVAIPSDKATWEEWIKAAREVAKKTGIKYPMALDRSGHRIAGPAISHGAKIFDEKGDAMLIDDAFSDFAAKFVGWNNDGTLAREVWAGAGGSYQDGSKEFISGELAYLYSGSWQVGKFNKEIGDSFDWEVVGSPCGAGGCSGMPGGAGIVGFKYSKHPEAVAKFLDFMARTENYAEFTARAQNIPAHLGVANAGVEYVGASPQAAAALNAWGKQVSKLSPIAYAFQGYRHNRAMFNISMNRITQAIVGELTVEQAMDRAKRDLESAMSEVK